MTEAIEAATVDAALLAKLFGTQVRRVFDIWDSIYEVKVVPLLISGSLVRAQHAERIKSIT